MDATTDDDDDDDVVASSTSSSRCLFASAILAAKSFCLLNLPVRLFIACSREEEDDAVYDDDVYDDE